MEVVLEVSVMKIVNSEVGGAENFDNSVDPSHLGGC